MSNISLSVVVMAHPRRADSAEKIRASCPELNLSVVFDPEPEAPPSPLRSFRTSMLAWSSTGDRATHHLVLQDDVQLCDDIAEELHAAIAAMPASPLYLYTDWGTKCSHLLRLGALRGAPWVEAVDPWVPAQAVLLPVGIADGFVRYVARRPELDDDAFALTAYLNANQLTAFVCMPNLVEHEYAPSLLGNDVPMGLRRATCFGRPSHLPVDWTASPLRAPAVLPDLLAGRSYCSVKRTDGVIGAWSNMPTYEWLAERGISVHDQTALFRDADASEWDGRRCGGLASVASDTLKFHFWLTGFVYGALIATWPEADKDWFIAALDRPLARRALATLVPGGLRELVVRDRLASASDMFLPLVIHAMRQGLDANTDGTLVTL
ncbi:MAG TPA: hypothetical protein VF070_48730 [Streptosporangiaceae bacterium]